MKAVLRYSDGLVQFIPVQEYESSDGNEVYLPGAIEVRRGEQRIRAVLTRITGKEGKEIPEYIEQVSA